MRSAVKLFSTDELLEIREKRFKVFGIELSTLIEREKAYGGVKHEIPLIVSQTIEYLRQSGSIREPGLFRLCGKHSELTEAKNHVDSGMLLSNEDLKAMNIHTVGDLFKLFLRSLPNPIIPRRYYPYFLLSTEFSEDDESLYLYLGSLLQTIPSECYNLLAYLCEFFREFVSYSSENKMGASNIAIIFSPSIFGQSDIVNMDSKTILLETQIISKLSQLFIEHSALLFSGEYNKAVLYEASESYNEEISIIKGEEIIVFGRKQTSTIGRGGYNVYDDNNNNNNNNKPKVNAMISGKHREISHEIISRICKIKEFSERTNGANNNISLIASSTHSFVGDHQRDSEPTYIPTIPTGKTPLNSISGGSGGSGSGNHFDKSKKSKHHRTKSEDFQATKFDFLGSGGGGGFGGGGGGFGGEEKKKEKKKSKLLADEISKISKKKEKKEEEMKEKKEKRINATVSSWYGNSSSGVTRSSTILSFPSSIMSKRRKTKSIALDKDTLMMIQSSSDSPHPSPSSSSNNNNSNVGGSGTPHSPVRIIESPALESPSRSPISPIVNSARLRSSTESHRLIIPCKINTQENNNHVDDGYLSDDT